MTRVVHTSPAGTLNAYRADGSHAGEFGYTNMTMTVEDGVHGGGESFDIEVLDCEAGDFLLLDTDEMRGRFLDPADPERKSYPRGEFVLRPAGRFVPINEAGSSEWRRRPKRTDLSSFSERRQDPPVENRKQRRAREAKDRRSR